jgi:hypothetical protein
VLLSVGALSVHDLRYVLAYHGQASHELTVQGHSYLQLVTPVVAGLVVLAAVAVASRVVRAYATGSSDDHMQARLSVSRMWLVASALLVGIYSTQEWLEGLSAEGHPGGIGAPFGHGGWLALPLALVIGLLIALALRGVAAAIAIAAARGRARLASPSPGHVPPAVGRSVWTALPQGALARRLSPRAPPAVV